MFVKKKLKQSLADKYNLYRETGETSQGLRGSAALPVPTPGSSACNFWSEKLLWD